MKSLVDEILVQHLVNERERLHLLTTLYGIVAPHEPLKCHLKIAKCMELMKASTLIVDDFLDKSPVRNGLPSLYSKLGSEEAVLLAEILKSSATIAFSQVLAKTPNLNEVDRYKCLLLFEDTYRTVCLGQLEEIKLTKEQMKYWSIKETEYWQMINKTTAVFIQLPLLLGAIVSHFDEPTESALRSYGLNIGLAYQVRDDILDLIGDPSITGKPFAGDIKEKKMRLAIIYFLHKGGKKEVNIIKKIYKKNQITQKDVRVVIEILTKTGSINYCLGKIKKLCTRAIKALSSIQNKTMVEQLQDVADLLVPTELD